MVEKRKLAKINKKEPEYISINILQNLEIEGLGQIRGKIIKDGDNGYWKSINCKKYRIIGI